MLSLIRLQASGLLLLLVGLCAADQRPRFITDADFDASGLTTPHRQPQPSITTYLAAPYTPNDGDIITVEIGTPKTITVIGENRGAMLINGTASPDTTETVEVVWEESPLLRGPDPVIEDVVIFPMGTERGEVASTEDVSIGELFHSKYTFTARKVGALHDNQICFSLINCEVPASARIAPTSRNCIGDWVFDPQLQQTRFHLSKVFYPQRCVFIHVVSAPQIVAIKAVDPGHMMGMNKFSASPGKIVQLRVQAHDLNDDDDVDVSLLKPSGSDSVAMSNYHLIGTGPRMCCNAVFEDCELKPPASLDCEQNCMTSCPTVAPKVDDNSTKVESRCIDQCTVECERDPCRFVQRDFRIEVVMPPPPGTPTQDTFQEGTMMLQFSAVDDSGRLSEEPEGSDRRSAVVDVQVDVENPIDPRFVDYTPPHGTRFLLQANCPMPAIGVPAFAQSDGLASFQVVPDGCEVGSKVRKEICIQEDCVDEAQATGCCCNKVQSEGTVVSVNIDQREVVLASTEIAIDDYYAEATITLTPLGTTSACGTVTNTIIQYTGATKTVKMAFIDPKLGDCSYKYEISQKCHLCLPAVPAMFEVSEIMSHLFQPSPAPNATEMEYSPYYVISASICSRSTGAFELKVWSNGWIAQGSHVVLSGVSGGDARIGASIGGSGQMLDFHGQSGQIAIAVPSGFMPSREVTVHLNVSVGMGIADLRFDDAMVMLNGSTVHPIDAGMFPIATTRPKNISACGCFYNCSTVYGEGNHIVDGMVVDGGWAKQRILRWTPGIEHMGQTFEICLSTLDVTNRSVIDLSLSMGDRRCYYMEVERCKYCVREGDTAETIAGEFGTHWMQLWSTNSFSGFHPDALVEGQLLHLGPVHILQQITKLSELAHALATTEKSLRMLNTDIPDEQMYLGVGRAVCVMPGICDTQVALDGTA